MPGSGDSLACHVGALQQAAFFTSFDFFSFSCEGTFYRPSLMQFSLDSIRAKGVRIMNVEKNTGEPKYAFNKLQLVALPKLLRAPASTIGSSTT
jgi:hypothetical protein